MASATISFLQWILDEFEAPVVEKDVNVNNTSATIQAILRTSRHERDELYATRNKLAGVLKFIKKKGFQKEHIYEDLLNDGISQKIPSHDEFGLPVRNSDTKSNKDKKEDEMLDKMPQSPGDKWKGKVDPNLSPVMSTDKLLGTSTTGEQNNGDGVKKNWSPVLKSPPPVINNVVFEFCPPHGTKVVTPPDEVLHQGLEKIKHCIVGTFSKGVLSYSDVNELATKLWSNHGLNKVSQKSANTFLWLKTLFSGRSIRTNAHWILLALCHIGFDWRSPATTIGVAVNITLPK